MNNILCTCASEESFTSPITLIEFYQKQGSRERNVYDHVYIYIDLGMHNDSIYVQSQQNTTVSKIESFKELSRYI